jgi:hypothetical protein
MTKPYIPGHHRGVSLTTRTLAERAAWGKRAKAIVHQAQLPVSKEKPMSSYEHDDVHSPWAALLREIRSLEQFHTGVWDVANRWGEAAGRLRELGDRFATSSLQHDKDLGRLLIAVSNLPIASNNSDDGIPL